MTWSAMDSWINSIPARLGESHFLPELAYRYAFAPSAALIRTAEAELLRSLPIKSPALDLCCGDGFFASLIAPAGFEAGCDISEPALHQAAGRNIYTSLACVDITRGIPFADGCFQTIVSNSSLEHVENIDSALREIGRVLKPGGRFYTTFASHYAYKWWPCGQNAQRRYLRFQPVYSYFPLGEWESRMATAGLRVVGSQYYLSRTVSRLLMFLDYHFSHVYMTPDSTLARPVIRVMRVIPRGILARVWKNLFARIKILAEGKGGAILIVAEREGM